MRALLANDSELILERLHDMLCIYKQLDVVVKVKSGNEALEFLTEIRKENKTLKSIILTFHATEYYKQMP